MFRRTKNQSTRRFWADVIEEKDFLELTDPPPIKEINYCLPPTPASLPDNLLDSEFLLEEPNSNKEELPDRASKPPSVVPENGTECEMIDLSDVPCAEPFSCDVPCSEPFSCDVQPVNVTDPSEPVKSQESPLEVESMIVDEEKTTVEIIPDGQEPKPQSEDPKLEGEEPKPECAESTPDGEVVSKVEGEDVLKQEGEEEVVPVEKPKIRMIDVPEDEMPQLPKQENKSLLWCEPVDYSKLAPLVEFMKSEDKEIFCLGRSSGVEDLLGQRVLQVATILRNLSFEEDNIPVLCKNQSFLR